MSNYTKATDFAIKDGLPSGDPAKVIKGTEFEDEFDAIATAVNSKADTENPTFTGVITTPAINFNGTLLTATGTELNLLDGVTATTAELNLLDGSTAGTVVNDKAVVYSSAGEVKATTVSLGNWVIKVDTNELVFVYNSTEVFKVGTNGAITSADNVTAFGTI
jgi:hypothetical protein